MLVARLVDDMVKSEKIAQMSDKHSFGLYEMVSEQKKRDSEPRQALVACLS